MRNNNKGFSVIEVLIIAVIVIGIAGAGWIVFKRRNTNSTATNKTETSQNQPSDKTISSKQDLNNTAKELNNTDIDGQLSTSDIDQALSE